MTTIHYPDAEALDTGNWHETSGYRVALYLVPADETEDGVPRVAIHAGLGNIGMPMRAYHGRWYQLGSYGPKIVGEDVLERLRSIEKMLLALSEAYQGAEWDGRNHVGSFEEDTQNWADTVLADAFDELGPYWDAADWYGAAGVRWEELAREAGVDPERALGDDWEAVAVEAADTIEPQQGEPVSGTRDYAREQAERYRDEREPHYYALVANRGQDQGRAEAVWTDYRDAGHPAVIADALARVEAAGGFSVVTWVYVDGPCEAGDLLDLTGDDGCASVVE